MRSADHHQLVPKVMHMRRNSLRRKEFKSRSWSVSFGPQPPAAGAADDVEVMVEPTNTTDKESDQDPDAQDYSSTTVRSIGSDAIGKLFSSCRAREKVVKSVETSRPNEDSTQSELLSDQQPQTEVSDNCLLNSSSTTTTLE